jgi:hypothetical protein
MNLSISWLQVTCLYCFITFYVFNASIIFHFCHVGIEEIKQLRRTWRNFVPPENQDQICQEPSE